MELIERKLQANKIANLYQLLGYDSYADRIRQCARFVGFVEKTFWIPVYDWDNPSEVVDVYESQPEYRLTNAVFCRVRHCPICQWRKSKRWQALALRNLPSLQVRYSNYRWLFLTLTIKNCRLSRLQSQVIRLNKSFLKWIKWKSFPADGWIKSLEVTLDKSNSSLCHPHFHVLLMVPENYFHDQEMYLTQSDWVQGWRKAAKLNYDPIIDIRAVPSGREDKIIPELLKYGVKPDDLAAATPRQLKLLTEQLHGVHSINKGGLLRNCFKDVGDDNVDLIGSSDDQGMLTGTELKMLWDNQVNGYQHLLFKHQKLEWVLMMNEDNFQSDDLMYEVPSSKMVERFSA